MDELVKRLRTATTLPVMNALCQEAADAIEELNKDLERSKEWEKFWEKEANEALKNFQTTVAKIPHWISVTERLPKMIDGENISKEVYVTDGTDIAEACIMRDYEGATDWTYTGIGEITHWCEQIPLPQPPKEG